MFTYPKRYDVIVVGGGHAGVEAALAGARMGCQTLLLTINLDTIGQMSCNPAIGGSAKGHLVREIDALGGEMGRNTDMCGIQFRMLNRKKGPAVWSPRAQCDKKAYQFRLKWICEQEQNLDVKQGQSFKLIHNHGVVRGVETTLGVRFISRAVVITTGTFLRGLMHIGRDQQAGGRAGEAAALGLSDSLREIGMELGRLKTGTPPRLLRQSIDFSRTEIQNGDSPIPYFSFWKGDLFHVEQDAETPLSSHAFESKYPKGSIVDRIQSQLPCFITQTTQETIRVIRKNIHLSPLYAGVIEGIGPRYCPSIEDKVIRFAEKDRHQVFLEPEGIETDEIYVNGLSTSLPFEVQVNLVRTIVGCEHAEIARPAYAVEYDYVFPTQLLPSLETKTCQNLYLAGQINGTSGYEEAGAQGLIAGINAARRVSNLPPVILRRDQAYIGVLIDDLVTKGTTEPYRMFTSRAEYRLTLRQDNADIRLSPLGREIGLLPESHITAFLRKREAIEKELERLKTRHIGSESLDQILRRPEISYENLPDRNERLTAEITQQVEIIIKYEGYINRQAVDVERFKTLEEKEIPPHFDYDLVPSLRLEARQKLAKIRPVTIGQAARISGVSPADVSLLLVWLKRQANGRTANSEPRPSGVEPFS